jgi:hypothetical protein
MSRRRIALGCLGAVVLAALGLAIAIALADEDRPTGRPGPEAEALADRLEAAVGREAWERTGAIRWTFSITGAHHLWDRERNWARVERGGSVVLVDLEEPTRGVATEGGVRLEGADAASRIRRGWEQWVNDSFWLVAPFKVRDPGTSRSIVEVDGQDALLVSYASGGVTPGDAYLWLLADDGTPRAWRMWVSVLPVGGVEVEWREWQPISTGARIARVRGGALEFRLDDVEGAETLAELVPGADPFEALATLPR